MNDTPHDRRRPRVMIVENEAVVAADLSQSLARMGCDVVAMASTGEQAVRLARDVNLDAVLMDIRLGRGMDGIHATSRIHEQSDVPVIYVTAHSDLQTLRLAQGTSPSGFLLKPFEERMLEATVQMAIYRHARQRYQTGMDATPDARSLRDFGINE